MTDLIVQENQAGQETPVLTKAMYELKHSADEQYVRATAEDFITARALAEIGVEPKRTLITQGIAAILCSDHNSVNRALSVTKVKSLRGDMERGDWLENHQGIAFYKDGSLADGQHRMWALATANLPEGAKGLYILVSSGFEKQSMDSIDRSTRRNMGETLVMQGIPDGKDLAFVAKESTIYRYAADHGARISLTDAQIKRRVRDDMDILRTALDIGKNSTAKVTDPCLSQRDASVIAAVMLHGGWGLQRTVSFLSSIQQGVASYSEAPTLVLGKLYLRAKIKAKMNDRLTTQAKVALALKGAVLWADEKCVRTLAWNQAKEPFPSYIKPDSVES